MNKEIRMAEMRAAEGQEEKRTVAGVAVVFESPTVIYKDGDIEYKEVIDRHALDNADLSDVPFKYNHTENVMIMARTRNKSLRLNVMDDGLHIEADLADTTAGNDMYKLIKRGDIDKMSFAFTVAEESYDYDTHTRRVLKIDRLYDVSAVDIPAYDATSISARAYCEEKAKEAKEREARAKELAELKAAILAKLS